MSDPVTTSTSDTQAAQIAADVRTAIGAYHAAADGVRAAIKTAEAAGLQIDHNLDTPLVAGEHVVTDIFHFVKTPL